MKRLLIVGYSIACFGQQPSASLSGTVLDDNGAPITAARLSLRSENGRLYVSRSSERGTFRFSNIVAGKYTLEFDQLGYCHAEVKAISIAAGEMKTLPRVVMAMPRESGACL